jgi:Secretion system C-terminal sorting domain/Beta-propeller repeat
MKTKYTIVVALIHVLLFTSSIDAQNPSFEWVKQMGGTSYDNGYSITSDASGNIYTTGRFSGTVDFDPGVGTTNLISAGGTDVFVQKLDANGDLLWVKQMSGITDVTGYSIATDLNGNVYTTGFFQGTIDFDPGIGTSNLTSLGYDDIFVQKLDANGDLLWVKHMGGTGYDYGMSITTDISGNVYTAGYFRNTVDFDPGVGVINLTSAGASDIFVQKLDTYGNFVWVKQVGGTSSENAQSITSDDFGAIYITGAFQGTADFDPGVGTTNLTSAGISDIFVQKLDTSGNFIWVKQMGATDIDAGMAITTDVNGNVYTTGTFRGTADFDPNAGTSNLTSAGGNDFFVQKLDSSGNFLWATQTGGTSHDFSSSITTDASENVYTIGQFNGMVDFDPDTGTTTLYSAGNTDIFIQKLDINGSFVWVAKMGSSSSEDGNSITIDANKNIYTIGNFQGTVDFDPDTGTTNLTTAGGNDIFIQKLSQCSPTSGIDVITACDSLTWIDGITYTSSNSSAIDTIINAAGCDSIVTLNLTINSVSDLTTSLIGVTITANNASANYVWLDCDNNYTAIPGETNQSFTATINGNYAVELTENGCVDTSACVAINSIGLEEKYFSENFFVYPNPTKGLITVECIGMESLEIVDIMGKVIYEITQLSNDEIKFDISEFSKGIYFVRVRTENGVGVERIVLE